MPGDRPAVARPRIICDTYNDLFIGGFQKATDLNPLFEKDAGICCTHAENNSKEFRNPQIHQKILLK